MVTPVTEVSDEDIAYIFWVKHSKNSTAILTVTAEVKRSSETSVTLHQSAIRNNTEDSNLHQNRFKALKSCLLKYFPYDSHKNIKLVQTNPGKYFTNMLISVHVCVRMHNCVDIYSYASLRPFPFT